MGRTNAVAGVSHRLFEDGWDRIKGGRQLSGARHMARAAQGASPAVFKMFRTGGCASRGQLSAQFSYLFSKSVDVHDSRGLLDGEKRLTPEQIERAVSRWTDDWRGQMNAARTTHVIMSFPRGAKPAHVSLFAGEICKEKLGGRFATWWPSIPTARKEPHAISSSTGEAGSRGITSPSVRYRIHLPGLQGGDGGSCRPLMASSLKTRRACSAAYQTTPHRWRVAAGKGKGCDDRHCLRGPFGQARTGDALSRATEEVRDGPCAIATLRATPRKRICKDLATAFEKASAVLSQGGVIVSKGEPYMSVQDDFDKAAEGLRRAVMTRRCGLPTRHRTSAPPWNASCPRHCLRSSICSRFGTGRAIERGGKRGGHLFGAERHRR